MAALNFSMPVLDESAPVNAQVKQLKTLVYNLSDQLRYAFSNIGEENLSPGYRDRLYLAEQAAGSMETVLNRLNLLADKRSLSYLIDKTDGLVAVSYQPEEPVSPHTGDIWYDTDAAPTAIYRFNGVLWEDITTVALEAALSAAGNAQATADGKIQTFAQSGQPEGVSPGDLWIKTDESNALYRWMGSEWVAVADTHNDQALESLIDTVDGKTTVYYQADTPANAHVGDVWYDTGEDPVVISRYDGVEWKDMTDTALSAALNAAQNASNLAYQKIQSFAQPAAPQTGMREGDLWFDTSKANKPHRYNGSGWVSYQDTHLDGIVATSAAYVDSISKYVEVVSVDGSGNQGVRINKAESEFYALFTAGELAFYQGSAKIAWFSNQTLFISRAEIADKLTLGTAAKGYFDFSSDNSRLTVRYRG